MRRDIVKLFKAYMLLMIFLLSLLPEPFMLKHLGITLRADTLVLWMAGIEAVDAWDEYKREKNKNKSNHGSGVKKNGKNKKMEQFQNCIVEAYTSGMIDGSGISLRQVSEEFGITLMKTRKILITAGVYHTENSEKINSMREQGMSIPEIMKATGLSKSSVHSYLPYTKIIYNVDELSLYAERCRMYRKRKQAVEQLQICKEASLECVEKYLWSTIEIFSGYSFTTVKGLRFRYAVNGNEIQINRKKKSITRSSVKVALKATLEKNENISGPKKLGVFGASYLYPMFLRFGLIDTERKLNGHLPDMDNI